MEKGECLKRLMVEDEEHMLLLLLLEIEAMEEGGGERERRVWYGLVWSGLGRFLV